MKVKIEAKYDLKQGKRHLGGLQQLCSWLVELSEVRPRFGYMQELKGGMRGIPLASEVKESGMVKKEGSTINKKGSEWTRIWGRKVV